MNYRGENIPDMYELTRETFYMLEQINTLKKFEFGDIFSKNKKGEYERRPDFMIVFSNVTTPGNLKEIKGLYILSEGEKTMYAGISKEVIRSLKDLFTGSSHHETSPVYLMAKEKYDNKVKLITHKNGRFPFQEYRADIQRHMIRSWKISIIPELDNYRLSLMELYAVCDLKAYWNTVETP